MQPQQTAKTNPQLARATGVLRPARPVEVETVRAIADDGPVRIITPRLTLRSLSEPDRPAFTEAVARSKAHLDRFLPLAPADHTPDQIFDRQHELTTEGDATGKSFRRAAFETATGQFIGAFNLVVIRRGLEMEADVSCWLAEGCTGKGLSTEALSALVSYSFSDLPEGLGLHRIDGHIAPDNQPSMRLASKLGFVKQNEAANHLSVGDRWQLHEKWSLSIETWLRDHA